MDTAYMPAAVSPPCETVKDLIEERGWSVDYLAGLMGWDDETAQRFLNNEIRIDEKLAAQLCLVTMASKSFWLARQQRYDERQEARRRNPVGDAERPQAVEVLLYEDRWGNHVLVVRANEQERRMKLERPTRASLGDEATLNLLGQLIGEVEVCE